MLLGAPSWSVTWLARMVTVQVSPRSKSVWGRLKVVGPPVGVTFCRPLLVQSMATVPAMVTGSLKVTSTVTSTGTLVATLAGLVSVTMGGTSTPQLLVGEAVLRGVGAPVLKSAALLSVSTQPAPLRMVAVVLEGAGAGPEPSKQLAVAAKPTKSMTLSTSRARAPLALWLY